MAKTTVFILTIDDPALAFCEQAIQKQTYNDFELDYIINIRPFNAAMQEAINRCNTEYFIQVDEDMIMYSDSVKMMQDRMDAAPDNIGMLCFHLFDKDRDLKIQGIKIYRTICFQGLVANNVLTSEMDLLEQLDNAGYRWLLCPEVAGNHGTYYTPETIYLRYKSMYQKDIKAWNSVTNDIRKKADLFRETGDPLQLFALLGAVHGIIEAPKADDKEIKDYAQYKLKEIELFRKLFLESPPFAFQYDATKGVNKKFSSPFPYDQVKWRKIIATSPIDDLPEQHFDSQCKRNRNIMAKPKILIMADIHKWFAEPLCHSICPQLLNEFEFTINFNGHLVAECDYDLIYPLESHMTNPVVKNKSKYISGINADSSRTLDCNDYRSIFRNALERQSGLSVHEGKHYSSKRILLACTHFWPSVGGVETIVEGLGSQLVERGYSVEVATWACSDRTATSHRGIKIIELEMTQTANGVPNWMMRLRNLALSGDYAACIFFADPQNHIIWSLEGARIPSKTRILIQPIINEDGYGNWRYNEIFRSRLTAILKQADGVIALSRNGAEMRFFREECITPIYIPNAVERLTGHQGFRTRYGINETIPLLLHVANFWPVKNHDGLLATLREMPGNWRLIMIGHPSSDSQYMERVSQAASQDPRIILILGLPPQEVAGAMAAADIVLLASFGEVSPVTIMEAMSHGKPWLATPSCGAVHDFAGGMIAPLERFPDIITHLLSHPEIMASLGRAGSGHWKSCFVWEVVASAWDELIQIGTLKTTFERPINSSIFMPDTINKVGIYASYPEMTFPLVSVIVPTYNRPDMLKNAIQSILDQTFQNFEIIIVNDAGQDISCFAQSFDSQKIICISHEFNKGLAAARNTGIRAAKGKYIAYLDDDDIYYPEHLETLVSFLENNNYKVAYTDSYRAYQQVVDGNYAVVRRDLLLSKDFDFDQILVDNFIPVLCVMHEKSCIEECGQFDETLKRHEDWDLWIRVSEKFPFVHLPVITSEYTSRDDCSAMTTGTLPMFLTTYLKIYEKYRYLTAHRPEILTRQKKSLYDFKKSLYSFLNTRIEPLVPYFVTNRTQEGKFKLSEILASGASQIQLESSINYLLGIHALHQGDNTTALAALNNALKFDQTNPLATLDLAAIYIKIGRLDDAVSLYELILDQNEGEVTALMVLGEIAQKRGEVSNARDFYTRALDSEPENIEAARHLMELNTLFKMSLTTTVTASTLKVAVFSLDRPDFACARIRLLDPCTALANAMELKWGVTQEINRIEVDHRITEWADLIVIQRFFPGENTWPLIEKILSHGKPVVYETDDLLINTPVTNPYKQGADAVTPFIFKLISKADAVTVSTEEMRLALSSHHRNIHVLPNLLDEQLWSMPPRIKGAQEPVVIGYAATPDHKADLALMDAVLERIAAKYGNQVAFCFMGCCTEGNKQLPGFLSISFELGYANYARVIQSAGIDIGIVPLLDNQFNRCKSNIKWLEYSACGIAGIYSNLPPYSAVVHGKTGLLVANTSEAWFNALDDLISNPDKRKEIAIQARQEVMTNYTVKAKSQLYLDTYKRIVKDYQPIVENPKFSVIILTWNRAEMLDRCLTSLFSSLSNPTECEVIVGNSGSTDDTDEVVARHPIGVYVKKDQNIGLELYKELFDRAKGVFIIIIDDDVLELPRHFDRVFESYFEEFPDYGYLGLDVVQNGLTNGAKPDDSFYRDDRRGERIIQEGPVVGCCAAIKRKTFLELDGFYGYQLSMKDGDDGVLCDKIRGSGMRTGIIKGIRCFHASGPAYSQQFGYLERDIRKYEGQKMTDFAKAYRNLQDTANNDSPQVSIIIPLFNKVDYTRHCLEALTLNTDESLNYEVILVDNASTDGTADYLRTLSGDITIITNKKNLGFAKAINQASKLATGRYLVLLNNDTIPHPEWLAALIRGVERDNADIVGAKLVYPNGRIQHAGVAFDEGNIGYHIYRKLPADLPAANKKRFMQCVTAACMLVKREVFSELKGFNEAYMNGFEDVDFCLRAGERGRKILYTPESVLIHFEETSEGRKHHEDQNMQRYLARWEGKVRCDDNDFYRIDGYRKEVIGNGRMRLHLQPPSPSPLQPTDTVNPTISRNAFAPSSGKERARALKGEGKYAEALAIFSRLLDDGDYSALVDMGDCLASLGRYDEALSRYNMAQSDDPADSRVHVGIGVLNLLKGNQTKAFESFSKALRYSPDNSRAQCGLGMSYFGMGKKNEAYDCFRKSLESDPENVTALHELIKASYELEQYEAAALHTQRYLMYHPLETDFLFSLAGLFYKQGSFREAIDTLERLLIVSPDYEGASEFIAKVQVELATLRPNPHPEPFMAGVGNHISVDAEFKTKGHVQKERGSFEEALKSFTLSRESGDFSVVVDMGDCQANLGNNDDALALYQDALERNPEDARALVGLGVVNLLQQKSNKAVMYFNKALKIDPTNSRALSGLGMVRNLQAKPKEAFTFFSKALDSDPENLNVLNDLLKIAYESNLLAEAEPYLRNYLRYHPANNHILFSLAGLLYRVGKNSEALDNLDSLLVFKPSYEGGQELRTLLITALESDNTADMLTTTL